MCGVIACQDTSWLVEQIGSGRRPRWASRLVTIDVVGYDDHNKLCVALFQLRDHPRRWSTNLRRRSFVLEVKPARADPTLRDVIHVFL